MPRTKRKIDYLLQRPGSRNWNVRLQYPGGRVIERSLGTSDRRQAEVLALPLIAEHKARLLAAEPRLEPSWHREYEPGLHDGPNGERIAATDRELSFYSTDGRLLRTEPNGGQRLKVVVDVPMGERVEIGIPGRPSSSAIKAFKQRFGIGDSTKRPANADDAMLETYLRHANVTGYYEREARDVWALYKRLTDDKPLKDATRDDGRKLVEYYDNEGLKSATIQKKLGWLTAAVNLAIKEGRLKFNPFSSIVPKRDDKQRRLPLDEADMKTAKRNLDRLDSKDQLLFRLLATTGMRLSEAFEIEGEQKERGVRYVIVGKKTEQSERRVPLPASLLASLPGAIKGRLFKHGDEAAASKRLNRFLDDIGIVDPRKVIHSLRHRAQDRLRAVGCPEDVRWAILGHEEKTVAAGYGEGFPVALLKRWVDKIGG
jgi:integrase